MSDDFFASFGLTPQEQSKSNEDINTNQYANQYNSIPLATQQPHQQQQQQQQHPQSQSQNQQYDQDFSQPEGWGFNEDEIMQQHDYGYENLDVGSQQLQSQPQYDQYDDGANQNPYAYTETSPNAYYNESYQPSFNNQYDQYDSSGQLDQTLEQRNDQLNTSFAQVDTSFAQVDTSFAQVDTPPFDEQYNQFEASVSHNGQLDENYERPKSDSLHQANTSFDQANTSFHQASTSFDQVNTSFDQVATSLDHGDAPAEEPITEQYDHYDTASYSNDPPTHAHDAAYEASEMPTANQSHNPDMQNDFYNNGAFRSTTDNEVVNNETAMHESEFTYNKDLTSPSAQSHIHQNYTPPDTYSTLQTQGPPHEEEQFDEIPVTSMDTAQAEISTESSNHANERSNISSSRPASIKSPGEMHSRGLPSHLAHEIRSEIAPLQVQKPVSPWVNQLPAEAVRSVKQAPEQTPQGIFCNTCSASNGPKAKYCGECGGRLAPKVMERSASAAPAIGWEPTPHPPKKATPLKQVRKRVNSRAPEDPLMRQGCSLITFGFGGKFVAMFPRAQTRYQPDGSFVTKLSAGDIQLRSLKSRGLFSAPISGPLFKLKKKEVSKAFESENEQFDNVNDQLLVELLRKGVEDGSLDFLNNPEDPFFTKLFQQSEGPQPIYQDQKLANRSSQLSSQINHNLLLGDRSAAVKCAVQSQQWEVALIIASSISKDSFNEVVASFAETCLPADNSLRSLFVAVSEGKNNVSQKALKWRNSVKMLLCNKIAGSSIALRKLGDDIHQNAVGPAQLCFMLAGTPPGALDDSKIRTVLFGGTANRHTSLYCSNLRNIRWTEYLEYILQGRNTQPLPYFQAYKYIYATYLADHGYIEEAAKYCALIVSTIKAYAAGSVYFHSPLLMGVIELSDRLNSTGAIKQTSENSGWFSKMPGFSKTALLDVFDRRINALMGVEEATPPPKVLSPIVQQQTHHHQPPLQQTETTHESMYQPPSQNGPYSQYQVQTQHYTQGVVPHNSLPQQYTPNDPTADPYQSNVPYQMQSPQQYTQADGYSTVYSAHDRSRSPRGRSPAAYDPIRNSASSNSTHTQYPNAQNVHNNQEAEQPPIDHQPQYSYGDQPAMIQSSQYNQQTTNYSTNSFDNTQYSLEQQMDKVHLDNTRVAPSNQYIQSEQPHAQYPPTSAPASGLQSPQMMMSSPLEPFPAQTTYTEADGIGEEDNGFGNSAKSPKPMSQAPSVTASEVKATEPEPEIARSRAPSMGILSTLSNFIPGLRGRSQSVSRPSTATAKPVDAQLGDTNSFRFDPVKKKWVSDAVTEDTGPALIAAPPKMTRSVSSAPTSHNPLPRAQSAGGLGVPQPMVSNGLAPPMGRSNSMKKNSRGRYVDGMGLGSGSSTPVPDMSSLLPQVPYTMSNGSVPGFQEPVLAGPGQGSRPGRQSRPLQSPPAR